MSVIIAKAVGRNEMPFGTGKDTHVVPSNTVLDRKGTLRGRNPIFRKKFPPKRFIMGMHAHV